MINVNIPATTTNDGFPDDRRQISAAFNFGIVDTRSGERVKVMPLLCASVIDWQDSEMEIDLDPEEDGDDDGAPAADTALLSAQLSTFADAGDKAESDDDGEDDNEDDEGDDADTAPDTDKDPDAEDDADTDADADDDEPTGVCSTYTQPQLVITVALTPAAIREYNAYLRNAAEDDDGALIAQIGYGPNPKEPVFWHTYEIDAADLELAQSGAGSIDDKGNVVAYMTLTVLGCTKFNSN